MSLYEAKTIFVMGYSLPMTDLAVRLFLHEGGQGSETKKDLYIVNPDFRVADRYRELLSQAYDIKDDYLDNDAVERFIDDRFG